MGKFIGIILLIGAVILILMLGKLPTLNQTSSKPSETPVAPTITHEIKSATPSSQSLSPAPQAIPDYLIPSGFTRAQLSSFFQKITISSAHASYSNYPSEIKLYSSLPKDEKINITGWRIKSNGGEIIIPQAINAYEPSDLIPPQDIVLSANNYVNIYLSINPINKSFRLNKCMGYLQNTYIFNPPLPQNCPIPSHSDISYLSGQCQSYILSLRECEIPDEDSDSFYTSVGGSSREEVECRAFLDTINQNGCFQKYHWDDDFLSNEWRVWVWQHILDSQHDKVLLFDKQGLLVDQYIY